MYLSLTTQTYNGISHNPNIFETFFEKRLRKTTKSSETRNSTALQEMLKFC